MEDNIGDILREFYGVYGRPEEGPPSGVNVSKILEEKSLQGIEIEVLRVALSDERLRVQFQECRVIAEDLYNRLSTEELLRDLSEVNLSERDYQELSSGVIWYALARGLDKRDQEGIPVTPYDEILSDAPLSVKIIMVVEGSLVLSLYLALVYMREGALNELMKQGANNGSQCCRLILKLLNSDYVRRIRNALSHGTFSSCAAGIAFRDKNNVLVATPGFLSWLSDLLLSIQLQSTAAGARGS